MVSVVGAVWGIKGEIDRHFTLHIWEHVVVVANMTISNHQAVHQTLTLLLVQLSIG